MDRKDIFIRTVKTFAQAFIGAMIPSLASSLSSIPETWAGMPAWLAQVFNPQLIIGSCCAAGVCAVWNAWLQYKEVTKNEQA